MSLIDEIITKAEAGDAFFVNRAAAKGDLDVLPENTARRIVAIANDVFAEDEAWFRLPQTPERQLVQQGQIDKHLNLATRVFFKAEGNSIPDEINRHYRR